VLPCLSEDGHFIFKGLQLGRCRIFDIQRFDGDWSVPMTSIYGSERAGSDSWTNQNLISRNLPIFDGFAGCADLKVKNNPPVRMMKRLKFWIRRLPFYYSHRHFGL
jgi:hypothetical protein